MSWPRERDLSRVSIRSPHKSKGRLYLLPTLFAVIPFQSAPLTKARGDRPTASRAHAAQSFNPLPSQKQGETRSPARETQRTGCFNPLPSQKQGETFLKPPRRRRGHVSIRSPHKSKGRLDLAGSFSSLFMFQSAPLTKARGDPTSDQRSMISSSFNPLPSQKQGETSSIILGRAAPTSFNPLPSQKQGETFLKPPRRRRGHVSIRSPHKSKGRLHPLAA